MKRIIKTNTSVSSFTILLSFVVATEYLEGLFTTTNCQPRQLLDHDHSWRTSLRLKQLLTLNNGVSMGPSRTDNSWTIVCSSDRYKFQNLANYQRLRRLAKGISRASHNCNPGRRRSGVDCTEQPKDSISKRKYIGLMI